MSNVPPPPPPGGGFPPPPPDGGGGFPPPPPGEQPPPAFGAQPYGGPGQAYAPPRASFGARLGAYVIDWLIVAAFNIPAWIALQVGPTKIDDCPDSISTNEFDLCEVPTSGTWAIAIALYVAAFAAAIAYYGIMEGKGATVGKKALGLRTADIQTGQPIGTGRAIGKYFARILSAIPCFLGFLWMLWDNQKQTWHDKMTSSVVVRDR